MIIRDVRPEDGEALAALYQYYVDHTAITFEYEAPTAEEFRNRIAKITEKYPYLVAEEDGTLLGYAYASVLKDRAAYSRCCELSIYVDKDHRRKGLGRALYEALEARLKAMGILNLYACIGSPITEDEYMTHDSERFHSRMGYVKIGEFHKCGYKFNRWYNMIWMEKIIGEHK